MVGVSEADNLQIIYHHSISSVSAMLKVIRHVFDLVVNTETATWFGWLALYVT